MSLQSAQHSFTAPHGEDRKYVYAKLVKYRDIIHFRFRHFRFRFYFYESEKLWRRNAI